MSSAIVSEEDTDSVACRGAGLEERSERAGGPKAGAFGLSWGGEDGGNGGGEGEAEREDRFKRSGR